MSAKDIVEEALAEMAVLKTRTGLMRLSDEIDLFTWVNEQPVHVRRIYRRIACRIRTKAARLYF